MAGFPFNIVKNIQTFRVRKIISCWKCVTYIFVSALFYSFFNNNSRLLLTWESPREMVFGAYSKAWNIAQWSYSENVFTYREQVIRDKLRSATTACVSCNKLFAPVHAAEPMGCFAIIIGNTFAPALEFVKNFRYLRRRQSDSMNNFYRFQVSPSRCSTVKRFATVLTPAGQC